MCRLADMAVVTITHALHVCSRRGSVLSTVPFPISPAYLPEERPTTVAESISVLSRTLAIARLPSWSHGSRVARRPCLFIVCGQEQWYRRAPTTSPVPVGRNGSGDADLRWM